MLAYSEKEPPVSRRPKSREETPISELERPEVRGGNQPLIKKPRLSEPKRGFPLR